MLTMSLGTIEVYGLPAAVLAADVACKAANVRLIGYETTDGMGMVSVKIEGQVAAVQAAIAAAAHAASELTTVFATSVIPRPNEQIGTVVLTPVTVGLKPEPPRESPSTSDDPAKGSQGQEAPPTEPEPASTTQEEEATPPAKPGADKPATPGGDSTTASATKPPTTRSRPNKKS